MTPYRDIIIFLDMINNDQNKILDLDGPDSDMTG